MIKETACYIDDFPVNIRIAHAEEYPLHFHQDIEFIYVLKGEINLKCGYFTYLLKQDDIFTINGREVHGLYQTDSDNIVALIQIENYFFSHYFDRLSRSCFRTFVNDAEDERLDTLRSYFVNILFEFLKKGPGYKQQIIDIINNLLTYLYEFFHYFSFEDKVVLNTRNDNPLIVERLGRIINYIYEKHSEKITLEDLSRLEHLSTYYISHLITESTRLSFREFLCFARVEFSEMLILDTNKKISSIAKEVGFSTTAYYIRYFQKWFGMAPENYRKKYTHGMRISGIPGKLKPVEPDMIFKLLRSNLNTLSRHEPGKNSVRHLRLDIQLEYDTPALKCFELSAILRCRASVLEKNFYPVAMLSQELQIKELCILLDDEKEQDFYQELMAQLKSEGIPLRSELPEKQKGPEIFGLDSIAANPYILKLGLSPQCSELTVNSLIDGSGESGGRDQFSQSSRDRLLNGEDGLFTAGLIPKPSYFAYKSLQLLEGDLIHWGKYHAVTRQPGGGTKPDSFCVVIYNQSEETENLCKRPSSMEETIGTLNGFDAVLDMNILLKGLAGRYQIMKYRIDSENCLLNHIARSGFSKRITKEERTLLTWLASPKIDISMEEVKGCLHISTSLTGVASECIIITPV